MNQEYLLTHEPQVWAVAEEKERNVENCQKNGDSISLSGKHETQNTTNPFTMHICMGCKNTQNIENFLKFVMWTK